MTFAQKFQRDFPKLAKDSYRYICPDSVGYEERSYCLGIGPAACGKCWNREMEKEDADI